MGELEDLRGQLATERLSKEGWIAAYRVSEKVHEGAKREIQHLQEEIIELKISRNRERAGDRTQKKSCGLILQLVKK